MALGGSERGLFSSFDSSAFEWLHEPHSKVRRSGFNWRNFL